MRAVYGVSIPTHLQPHSLAETTNRRQKAVPSRLAREKSRQVVGGATNYCGPRRARADTSSLISSRPVMTTKQQRRALRRAESRHFEAIEAADAGELALAAELMNRASVPRRAGLANIAADRAWIAARNRRP